MYNSRLGVSIIGMIALLLAGCASEPTSQEDRNNLRDESQTALSRMEQRDPDLRGLIDRNYGYAILPSVAKGGAIVGGASGRGEVYEQGRFIGYCEMNQGTVGAQLGGQTYSELIIFESRDALERFTSGNFKFSANASAVALKSGASTAARFTEGVAVFTLPSGGLMLEASIGGQKFSFQRRESSESMR